MTYKPIPTKKFKKFFKQRGLKQIRNHGDHEIWDFPKDSQLLRPITIVGYEKEIPAFHIQTNLKTLNISYEDFIKEITC
jgi:hypothetical protein